MLNKYEASDELVGEHVELKILLNKISSLVGQNFDTGNSKVIKFNFECYPEPIPSQQVTCANSIRVSTFFLLFD